MLAEAKDATIASKSWFAVRLPRCFERMQIPKINPNRLESEVGADLYQLGRVSSRSDEYVGHNYENSELCGEPANWPYTGRRESVSRNIEEPGNDEHPSPNRR